VIGGLVGQRVLSGQVEETVKAIEARPLDLSEVAT
jgi:hypothetical protein